MNLLRFHDLILCNLFLSAQKPIKKYKAFGVLSHFLQIISKYPDVQGFHTGFGLSYLLMASSSTFKLSTSLAKEVKKRAVTAATEMHLGSLYWMLQDFWPLVSLGKLPFQGGESTHQTYYVRLRNRTRGFGLNADDP